jgi:3-oxoacyl-[acyl-carrier-protein] synthase-3
LEAACCGFVFAITQAAGMIASGVARNCLVIGAEALSRITDYQDRSSCILFGDGAGAAILTPSRGTGEILFSEMGADGSRPEILYVPAGGSRRPTTEETVRNREQFMRLVGREVFKVAVNKLGELVERIPVETGVSFDQIKIVIPHQSNERIIRSVCERAQIPPEKAYLNIDRVGNTSAASIPIALDELVEAGQIERGDLVLLLAFGGGFTWGSLLLRY